MSNYINEAKFNRKPISLGRLMPNKEMSNKSSLIRYPLTSEEREKIMMAACEEQAASDIAHAMEMRIVKIKNEKNKKKEERIVPLQREEDEDTDDEEFCLFS